MLLAVPLYKRQSLPACSLCGEANGLRSTQVTIPFYLAAQFLRVSDGEEASWRGSPLCRRRRIASPLAFDLGVWLIRARSGGASGARGSGGSCGRSACQSGSSHTRRYYRDGRRGCWRGWRGRTWEIGLARLGTRPWLGRRWSGGWRCRLNHWFTGLVLNCERGCSRSWRWARTWLIRIGASSRVFWLWPCLLLAGQAVSAADPSSCLLAREVGVEACSEWQSRLLRVARVEALLLSSPSPRAASSCVSQSRKGYTRALPCAWAVPLRICREPPLGS